MQTSLFLLIVEIAGTIAFAISGIRLAAAKNFDWFGAYVVGLVTAIGGGTLRDVLLGTTPFWMQNGWYMGVTGLSLLFVILMGIAIGIIIGYPSLRIKGIYLALTTLGFSEIVRILVTNLMDLTGGPSGVRAIPGFTFFGLQINSAHSYLFLFMAILFVLLVLTVYITNSKWGRAIKAVANNELAVEACGIRLSTVKVFAFTLCCVYGCIGGALYAHLIGYISPSDFSMKLTIKYLMMLMVGGIGSTGGNVLGAVLVTLLPELLRKFDNYYWLIFSAFMLIMAIFNPYGLLEIVQKITRYFRDKTGKKAEKNG